MHDDDFAKGIELMRAVLGEEAAAGALARHEKGVRDGDPDRPDLAIKLAWGFLFGRPQLSLRERAIVLIASDVAQGGVPLALEDHVRVALHAGMTRDEILEIVFQLAPYCGFPRTRAAGVVINALFASLDAPS